MGQPAKKLAPEVSSRGFDYPTESHRKADELLAGIAEAAEALKAVESSWKAELSDFTAKWKAKIDPLKAVIAGLEKSLEKLMKARKADLFDGADRIDLAHGALLFSIRERVKRAKGVLARLEEIGAKDGLLVTTSVNWDALEKWSDERLIEAGTERVRENCFSYEVFQK